MGKYANILVMIWLGFLEKGVFRERTRFQSWILLCWDTGTLQ